MNQRAKVTFTPLLAILFLLIFASASFAINYPGLNQNKPEPFVIDNILTIQFEDNVDLEVSSKMQRGFGLVSFNLPSLDNLLSKYGVVDAKKIFPMEKNKPATNSGMVDLTRYYELTFSKGVDIQQVINELSQNPNLRMAEEVWAMPVDAVPNDPLWTNQWAMSSPGPDPNFYSAWDYETGSDSIKFALIDTGILYKHQDLEGNVWVNPGEDLDGDGVVFDEDDFNGIDDDGNGLIDDVIGYDFFSGLSGGVWPGEDAGTRDNDPSDFNGHGTHVAGIAAAMNNNGIDVTGAAGGWFGGHRSYRGIRIICTRMGATGTDGRGYVNSNDAAAAINYSVNMGVHVINASWGGGSTSAAAANNAVAAGVTFTHAAGNDDSNSPDNIDGISAVISVASTGPSSDNKSSFSNWGNWVDVAAPGSDILSTYSFSYTPGTASIGGTSMAAPMVSGLALLIRSQMPSLSGAQVDSIILATADSLALYTANPLYQGLLGSGRIDALAALVDLANAKFTSDVTEGVAPLTVNFSDLSPNSPIGWDWTFGNGDVSTDQNPQYVYNNPGIYDVSLIIDENNPLGPGEEHLKRYVWVRQDSILGDSVDATFNSEVVIPIYLHNTSQIMEMQYVFSYANTLDVDFDSISVEGTRADYFETVTMNAFDAWNKRISVFMKTNTSVGSTYLQADTGIVLKLHLSVGNNGTTGLMILDTTTFNSKSSYIRSMYGDYFPVGYSPGIINVGGCCLGIRGNFDDDPLDQIDISDLVGLVAFMFQSGAAPVCEEEANIDGSTGVPLIDIADLVLLVDYMFQSGPAPASCN